MDLDFNTWSERVTLDLTEWSDNDHIDGELADELARMLSNGQNMLARIDEAVSAYAAGAANAGDPDAVVSEVALILAGENPTPHLVRESLSRGLEQSAAGDVVDLGDFTQYADDEDEYGMGLDTAESLNAEALAELAYDDEPMDDNTRRLVSRKEN